MITIPERIKIGHLSIKVISIDQNKPSAPMRINCDQDESQVVETVIHECLHALWAVAGFSSKDDEEDHVSRLAPLLLMLLADNPELIDLLDQYVIGKN